MKRRVTDDLVVPGSCTSGSRRSRRQRSNEDEDASTAGMLSPSSSSSNPPSPSLSSVSSSPSLSSVSAFYPTSFASPLSALPQRFGSSLFGTALSPTCPNGANFLPPNVNPHGAKRAGPYLLGPRLGNSPVRSIVQCLARKEGTDDFFQLKILTLDEDIKETQDERQGKMLLHTEYSLLSLLHNQEGVVHHHGLFQDKAYEIKKQETSKSCANSPGNVKRRICLVLDCLVAHDFSDKTIDLMNLQHYVIKEKKLSEKETIIIFFDIVRNVNSLHMKNIVHRDLKLGNMTLNKRTRRITITNFCLGKHLVSENDLLKDQRGSPAYISPDVLS
ncbi:serine/threonine-protein kinase 40-like, partial [Saccoglossus kowalevskii]|uniref:Serine/threonine-protein kinase 40 n=1 Tax=Saccoglossus kowalevskii TaxID=10224 RepID=A0ABM0GNF4_SACKO